MKKRSLLRFYLMALVLLLGAVLLSVAVGSIFIPPADIFRVFLGKVPLSSGGGVFQSIIFQLRLPRMVMLLLVGAALAGSGGAYQGLFRNPLADPYLIGVASGAGLGAILAMAIHLPDSPLGLFLVPLLAFLTAILTVFIVYQLARVGKTIPVTNLILAGVAASSFATALTSMLMINATGELRRAVVWMLGGATLSGWPAVLAVFPYIAIGLAVLLFMGHPLNVLQFGEEQAQQLGLRVSTVRMLIVAAATLASAAAVAFAGIIAFVGLIVPHFVRLGWTSDYRHLLPLSMIGGAAMLLFSDVIARSILAPQVLPVGIITALIGAPFFFWVLRRAKQQNYW
jgi:iron complex transport system permease protein